MRASVVMIAVVVLAAMTFSGAVAAEEERPEGFLAPIVHNDSVIIEGDLDLSPPESLTFARFRMNDPGGRTWQFNTIHNELHLNSGGVLDLLAFESYDQPLEIGVGHLDPEATLHLKLTDGTTALRVTEGSSLEARRRLVQLENPGPIELGFIDQSGTTNEWRVGTKGPNAFEIARVGGGAFKALFNSKGDVIMGSGGNTFHLRRNGNLAIAGRLIENSSRTAKQDLVPVETGTLLDRVAALPVYEWSYRGSPGARHVGPMAEDFRAAFGLGPSPDGLAPGDVAGVGLAAVQALAAENAALSARVAELERLVAELAGS